MGRLLLGGERCVSMLGRFCTTHGCRGMWGGGRAAGEEESRIDAQSYVTFTLLRGRCDSIFFHAFSVPPQAQWTELRFSRSRLCSLRQWETAGGGRRVLWS